MKQSASWTQDKMVFSAIAKVFYYNICDVFDTKITDKLLYKC